MLEVAQQPLKALIANQVLSVAQFGTFSDRPRPIVKANLVHLEDPVVPVVLPQQLYRLFRLCRVEILYRVTVLQYRLRLDFFADLEPGLGQ